MTKRAIILFNLFFTLNLVYKLYEYILSNSFDYSKQSNFINYSEGFIRRGLWGEVVKIIHSLNINTFYFIKFFSLTIFIVIIYYFYKQFKKNDFSINFLFLPFSISYIFLSNFIEFKDYFLILLIIILCRILKSKFDQKLIFILLNSLLIFGIFIHEQFFFLTIPFLILYFADKNSENSNIYQKFLIYTLYFIPSIFALLLTIKYHGGEEIAKKIFQDSLKYIPKNIETYQMTGGIGSLGGNLTFKLNYMFKDLIWNGFSRGVSYTLFLLTLLYITLNFNLFKIKKVTKHKNIKLFTFFLFQLIMMMPIFLVAIDWSRFISLSLLSAFVLYFEIPNLNNIKITNFQNIIFKKSDYLFKIIIKDNIDTFYIVNYFCIIPYLELGNSPWQFTNSIIMLMNYTTKIISIL